MNLSSAIQIPAGGRLIPAVVTEPSRFQISKNGEHLHLHEDPPSVVLGRWRGRVAGQVVHLTSLYQLGWPGADAAVYVTRLRDGSLVEMDGFHVGDTGGLVKGLDKRNMRVILPELCCLAPQQTLDQDPSVVFAAVNEDGYASIFLSSYNFPLVDRIHHLEDFWVRGGKLWVLNRGARSSLSDQVEWTVRIYDQGSLVHSATMRGYSGCRRPVLCRNSLVWPLFVNGRWQLCRDGKTFWQGSGLSNLFVHQDDVFCLVSETPGIWQTMKDGAIGEASHIGQLQHEVSAWNGKLLYKLRYRDVCDVVVFDEQDYKAHQEVDHRFLVIYKGKPVYPVRLEDNSWTIAWGNERIAQPCERVLGVDSSRVLIAHVLRGGKVLAEPLKV